MGKDVSALANTESGLLVVGVRDPDREGEPPAPGTLLGLRLRRCLPERTRVIFLGSIPPPLHCSSIACFLRAARRRAADTM